MQSSSGRERKLLVDPDAGFIYLWSARIFKRNSRHVRAGGDHGMKLSMFHADAGRSGRRAHMRTFDRVPDPRPPEAAAP